MSDLPDVEATVKVLKSILSEGVDLASEKRRFQGFLQDYAGRARTEQGLQLERKHLNVLMLGMRYRRFDAVVKGRGDAAGLVGLGDWLARQEGYDKGLCQWVEAVWSKSLGLATDIELDSKANRRRAKEEKRRKADERARRGNAGALEMAFNEKGEIIRKSGSQRQTKKNKAARPPAVYAAAGEMKLETAFGDWLIQEDTVIDLHNGLMWPRSPLGEVTIGCGKIVKESWTSMTKKYGRGVAVASDRRTLGDMVIQSRPLSTYERGYTPGQERVTYAGFSDWRLPTLDEAATLTFNESWGTRKVKTGEEDSRKIFRILFNASCMETGIQFCTATRRRNTNSTAIAINVLTDILNWLTILPTVVWLLDPNGTDGPYLWDYEAAAEYSALLVRRHNP